MASRITIFLASSSELRAERSSMEIFIGRKNKLWAARGIRLELVHWEDFDDAMSAAGKQADYNAALEGCDLFLLLVHTKLGKYSKEEFEAAWLQFQRTKAKPRIYVYLKNPPEAGEPEPGPGYATVRAFQDRLAELKHYPTVYHDVNGLLLHFEQTLDRLDAKGLLQPHPPSPPPPPATPSVQVGAGAVYVGGGNQGNINTGTQTVGTQVFGGVRVERGDFVSGDKHVHAGADSAQPLAELLAAIQRLAPPASRDLAVEHVQEVQATASAGKGKVDDGRLARLLNGLVDLVPAAVGAVTGAFASPLLAGIAGPATEALLKKLRSE